MQESSPLSQQVRAAIEPVLAHAGYDIVLVEFLPGARILRLYIDLPYGPQGEAQAQEAVVAAALAPQAPPAGARSITLEDCTKVSRLVSDLLDDANIIAATEGKERSYQLEVSSPGLDRPLVTPQHFQRFLGHPVHLRCRTRIDGLTQRRFDALLKAADDDGILIALGDEEHRIAYSDLDRVQLVPQL